MIAHRALPLTLATALSMGALATAWAFQLIGGYLPCQLCLVQRNPYYLGIPILVGALVLLLSGRRVGARVLSSVAAVVFLVGTAVGIYHAGAE